jgi:outer membrane lipoprotein-sorting protein
MGRNAPWLVALLFLLGALVGGGVWFYRSVQAETREVVRLAPQDIIRNAWTDGREVALSGRQSIRMPGPKGKPIEVDADVLTSSDGQVRIEYLTEPLKGVTIWENGERTYRYNPALTSLTVAQKASPSEEAHRELQLLRNYTARVEGTTTIAGDRRAVVVELRPKSGDKRWKRVWVDPQTWVILATEERSGDKDVLRSARFTRVEYLRTPPPADRFRPRQDLIDLYGTVGEGGSSRFDPKRLSKLLGFEVRLPAAVPKGFSLQGAYQTPCFCGRRHQSARLEYSDGLRSITFYECGHPDCSAADNCSGAPRSSDSSVRYKDTSGPRPYWYRVTGDAPRGTLERMVRSAASK